MDKEIIHKEIDLIQSVINRMANNSFLLKGWLISIIAVVLALSKDSIISKNNYAIFIILLLPSLTFWYLDAFFLHKERCYRKLYDWVIENRKNCADYLYSLNYKRFEKEVKSIFKIMFSTTLIVFYGLPFLFLISIIIYKYFG
ncbi:MAG: hypothetical protein K8R58_10595 [Bacteroidales bacterium]|nr:hypothetical protein [Bacteroidales bacterium]